MRISDWSSDVCSSDLLTLQLSDAHFLRNLQVGFRYNRRLTSRYYGYRDGFPRVGGAQTPLTDFPGGGDAGLTGPPIGGIDSLSWYRLQGAALLAHIAAFPRSIQQSPPGTPNPFSTTLPPAN